MMDFINFILTENDSERRLDKVVRRILPQTPLTAIYKHIRKGLIKLNQKRAKAETIVKTGDTIQIAAFLKDDISIQQQKKTVIKNPTIAIEDIFINEHIRIINKPYDINVHGDSKEKTSLADIIANDFFEKEKNQSLSFRPGPLHRLDRKTTGIIAFSQSLTGARWFSNAIQHHDISKTYLAILEGTLDSTKKWTDAIERKSEAKNNSFITSKCSSDGKDAVSIVQPVDYGTYNNKPVTIAKIEILTGRTHQIRVHCSSHGFPLLGDTAYGGTKINEKQNFFLHAWHLGICKNPLSLPQDIYAPIPVYFMNMLNKCLPNFDSKPYNIKSYEGIK